MRQRGRFAGFSLFVSNTTDMNEGHLCYKDGPELPPLDFNTTCITHGRFVIFYNERLDRIKYPDNYQVSPVFTELCEVTVLGILASSLFDLNVLIGKQWDNRIIVIHLRVTVLLYRGTIMKKFYTYNFLPSVVKKHLC